MMRRATLVLTLCLGATDCRCSSDTPQFAPIPQPRPAPPVAAADPAVALPFPTFPSQALDASGREQPPTSDQVRAALDPLLDGVANCVRHAFPPAGAQLRLEFSLLPSGKLGVARVEGLTGADNCVTGVLGALALAPWRGESTGIIVQLQQDGHPVPLRPDRD